jgi:hypothetical protein
MQRRTPTLLDSLDLFLLDCEARLTLSTPLFYHAKLSVFIRWCGEHGVVQLDELTSPDIRRFLVHCPSPQPDYGQPGGFLYWPHRTARTPGLGGGIRRRDESGRPRTAFTAGIWTVLPAFL